MCFEQSASESARQPSLIELRRCTRQVSKRITMPSTTKRRLEAGQYNLKDQVVAINRVTKVVKGGKNLSFAALVVVGDPGSAVVGYGAGKAKEVPQAIRKGIEAAKKNLRRVALTQSTIPHMVLGRYGSGHVLLKPAPE